MTTTSSYPYLKAHQILASILWVIWVRKISAANPFPAISGKIENAIGTCTLRQATDGPEIVPPRAEMRPTPIRRLVSPRVFSSIGSPRRFFPLGFGRQTLSKPCTISHSAIPRGFYHRIILRTRVRCPFVCPPVNPGVVVIDVIPTLSVSGLGALGIQKLRELRVCHRRSIDEKFSDIDLMLRP